MVGNYIPDLILVDTKTGKKFKIEQFGTQLVAGPYETEVEAEIEIGRLLEEHSKELEEGEES